MPVAGPPSQSQFFGALMVAALILVCTAVVMTDRPVWMVGEEPPMGMLRPFSEPAPAQPVYTQDQLKAMATMGKSPLLKIGRTMKSSTGAKASMSLEWLRG